MQTFFDVQKTLQNSLFNDIAFTPEELGWYRDFAHHLTRVISKIENGTKYFDDLERLKTQLEAIHRTCMLEENVPDHVRILRCFLIGTYRYFKQREFPVYVLRDFVSLLKRISHEKQRIVLSHLHTRLDNVERSEPAPPSSKAELDDDIPF